VFEERETDDNASLRLDFGQNEMLFAFGEMDMYDSTASGDRAEEVFGRDGSVALLLGRNFKLREEIS